MVSSISIKYEQFYVLLIIWLQTVEYFQLLPYINNNSINSQLGQ